MEISGQLSNLLADRDNWQLLKQDRHISVYKSPLGAIVKEYHFTNLIKRYGFARKLQRVRTFFETFGQQGAKVPILLASGKADNGQTGYLVYSAMPGLDLRQFRWGMFSTDTTARIGAAIGTVLAEMHRSGWVHGDFKFANVMLDRADKDTAAVAIVDLEGVSKVRLFGRSRYARDAARFLLNGLEVQAPDALLEHFWLAYCAEVKTRRQRQMAAAVRHWIKRLQGRHMRKGRPAVDLGRLTFLP